MVPMLIVCAYTLTCRHRDEIRRMLRPCWWPLLWYVCFGFFGGIASAQPALCAWKAAEIIILLMWVCASCRDRASTQLEFIAVVRLVEVLLWATVVLAVVNPALGLRPSPSVLPWLQGYYPIINPNQLGFMSVTALARLLYLPAKFKPLRISLVLCTLVCSQSRTSYAVALLILFFFIIDGLRERQFVRVCIACFAVLAGLFILLGFHDAVVRIVMRGQDEASLGTLSGRTDYWAFALEYVSWFGKGLATGSRSLIFIAGQDTFLRGSVNLHNSFIEALIGAGYIGAIPYLLAFVFNQIRQGFRTLKRPSILEGLFLVISVEFIARSMTSTVMALFSYDFFLLMMAWARLYSGGAAAGRRHVTKPKPEVYEKTRYEQDRGIFPH